MGCASSKTSCVAPDATTGASMPRHHHRDDRCNAEEEQRSAAAAAAWSAATSADPDERPATAMRNGITTDVAVGDWCPVPLAQPCCSGETTCDFAHASETPRDDPCSTTLDDDDNAAWLANATAAVGCAVPPLPLDSPSAASCLINPLAPPTQVPSDTQSSSVETVIAFTVHSVHAADDAASLDPVAMVVGVAEADEERTSSVVVLETWSAACDLDASRPPLSPGSGPASPPRGVALRVPRTPTSRASAPPLSSRGLLWQ